MLYLKPKACIIAVFLLCCTLSGLRAQDEEYVCTCSQSDVSPAGVMNTHPHRQGSWMLSYTFMQMRAQGNQQGTQSISQESIYNTYIMAPTSMTMNMHMLMAMYGITDRLSVMGMLNYNTAIMHMEMLPSTQHHHEGGVSGSTANATSMEETSAGLGDLSLYADYALLNHENRKLLLYAGLGIPTGRTHILNNDGMIPGERAPYDMQTGTGSWDITPGITYLYQSSHFYSGSQVYAVWHTNYNSLGYRWGNSLELNQWVAYKPLEWISGSLRLNGSFAQAISGDDASLYTVMEPSANAANYGGTRLLLAPGINFYLAHGLLSGSRLGLEYVLPVYQKLNGIQMPWHSMLTAGLRHTF